MTLLTTIIALLLSLGIFILWLRAKGELNKLKEKYLPIISIEKEVDRLQSSAAQIQKETAEARDNYAEKRAFLHKLEQQVAIYDERLSFAEPAVLSPTARPSTRCCFLRALPYASATAADTAVGAWNAHELASKPTPSTCTWAAARACCPKRCCPAALLQNASISLSCRVLSSLRLGLGKAGELGRVSPCRTPRARASAGRRARPRWAGAHSAPDPYARASQRACLAVPVQKSRGFGPLHLVPAKIEKVILALSSIRNGHCVALALSSIRRGHNGSF